jgi:long-subunit acyl-CoA synthetase (AMP-forming)
LQSGYTPVFLDPQISDEYFQYVKMKLNPKLIINDENIDDVVSCQSFDNITNGFANAFILLSSGTTGLPKIVEFDGETICAQLLLAHGIIKQSKAIRNFNKISALKLLMFLPLHHVFGLMANFLWFTFFGFKFVFINSLNSEEIQAACIRHKITHFMGVPVVWETVSKKI